MRCMVIALCCVAMLLSFPTVSPGQIITHTWYFNDGPGTLYQWGDSDPQLGQFWEWMAPDAIAPYDSLCGMADLLQPNQEYYATTVRMADQTYWCHFWAKIYLSNNYPNHSNPVYAAIGYGVAAYNTFTQVSPTVTVNVTNMTMSCGQPYTFDFGVVPAFTLTNRALIIKIWTTVPPGDVHIYWDSECCPSALYADCTVPAELETWGRIKQLYGEE